jgi:transcriptional regulator with XRE-family HTH domain
VIIFAFKGDISTLADATRPCRRFMRITSELTEAALLNEFGGRLERCRIDASLTQAQLAEEAGISKRTVERIEAGHSIDFAMLLRVLRVLKCLEALDQLVPASPQSPLMLLKGRGRERKRVKHSRHPPDDTGAPKSTPPWKWGD